MVALAARRLWRHRALAAAQLVAVAVVVAVATAIALVSAGAADAGLRSLLAASPATSTVLIEAPDIRSARSLEKLRSATQADVANRVGDALAPAGAYGRLSDITVTTLSGQRTSADTGAPALANFPDLRQRAQLVAGAWPIGPVAADEPVPVAVKEGGAEVLGLHVGDVYCFEATDLKPPPWPSFCTRIAAVWRPSDPKWWAGPSEFDLVTDADDYFALAGSIGNAYALGGVAYTVVPSAFTADRSDALLTGMRSLRARYTVETNDIFITGLDSSLSVFVLRSHVDAFTVELLSAGLLLVAAYAAAFLGGHFLAAQEPAVALLRVRGWTRLRVWLLLVAEFCLLAVPALPLGVVAGAVASRAVLTVVAGGGQASLDAQADLAPVVVALLLPLAVLAVLAAETSRRSILEIRRALSRPPSVPWWRWRHLDLVLGLLSIPLLGEARLRGSAELRAAQADDPVALLLPGIAIACLALVSLRLLPLVSRICRLAPRNISALLAWWHLSRQPGEHAGLAVLVSLAVALGLFAGVYSTTERQAVVDRAGYAAGADLRASFDAGAQAGHLEAVAGQLPGVTRWTGVQRETAFIGYHLNQATLLGVNEADFARTAWSRADVSTSAALRQLAAADPDGAPLPDGADTLSISAVSPGLDAVMFAELVDGSGERRMVRLGDLGAAGPIQLRARFGGLGLGRGVRLRSLRISATAGRRHLGKLFLSVEGGWLASGGGLLRPYYPLAEASHGDALDVPVDLSSDDVTLYPTPTLKPLPVLLSRATADALGLRVGHRLTIQVGEYDDAAVVVGLVDYVPTFYPGQDDFIVAPLTSLRARFVAAGFPVDYANELWANVRGDGAAAAHLLNADRSVTSVDSRAVRAAQGLSDPLLLQLDANLRIGFAAALLLAVVGFAVHFLITSRRRVADSAILRANGLPAGVVRRGLAAEQLVLLLFSVGIGSLLGGVLAYALLPGLELGTSVSDRVPPTLTTFDPGALFLAVGGVVVAALLLAWAAGRGSTVDAVEELRTLG